MEISFCDHSRQIPIESLKAPSVLDLGTVELGMPEFGEPSLRRAALELRGPDGQLLAQDHIDFVVHPRRQRPFTPASSSGRRTRTSASTCRRWATRPHGRSESTLVVSRTHTRRSRTTCARARASSLVPEDEMSLYPFFPHWQAVKVQARKGTLWAGDWASSFAWMRRSGHFARFPSGPLLDETMDRVLPEYVISGCNLLDFQARVFAGLVVGWIHKPVALGVERSYGRGRLVAATLRLFRDAPMADPAATVLLDTLVELAIEARAPRSEEAVPGRRSRGLRLEARAARCCRGSPKPPAVLLGRELHRIRGPILSSSWKKRSIAPSSGGSSTPLSLVQSRIQRRPVRGGGHKAVVEAAEPCGRRGEVARTSRRSWSCATVPSRRRSRGSGSRARDPAHRWATRYRPPPRRGSRRPAR